MEPIYISNKYHAAAACEHCEGIIRHARWCITVNVNVLYSYKCVLDAANMSAKDHEWLNEMGVLWVNIKSYGGGCSNSQDALQTQTRLISLS